MFREPGFAAGTIKKIAACVLENAADERDFCKIVIFNDLYGLLGKAADLLQKKSPPHFFRFQKKLLNSRIFLPMREKTKVSAHLFRNYVYL
jgi:hypothetical protein